MNSSKPVAVVILNWNGERLLKKFLPSVLEHSDAKVSEIIIADNGSTDGSVALLEQDFPTVKMITFDKNYGFAGGYNKALAALDNKYVVLLNSDVAVTPGWDVELFDFMERNADVAACQPKLLSYNNPESFEYAGACGGFLDKNGYPYCRGRIFATCEKDAGQYDNVIDIAWASGAALMVRRELYLECGGLDPDFFAHMEEIDLCWRMRLAGYRICVVPSSAVYHLGGGSLPAENPYKTYLNFRNNLLMLHKNLPKNVRSRILLRRRLLDTVAWAKFILTFDLKNAAAIFSAHRDFAKMRRKYDSDVDANLLAVDSDSKRNIIIDYYLKGKKRYSELSK